MIKDAMEKNEKATPNGADLELVRRSATVIRSM